ncbi:MAG TPA: dihydrofolate reductase [Pyrinomonadaceae bacterium]|jgi:dihydrofolate reductase|nr:dihydrofolate reductase [Pyrinomonadaceae bacterium]
MAIIGIVAVARNNAIGKDGKLPWHYSADLKHFKETTTGQAVVMGMNTWRSIGKPLPNRLNIVLSRSAQIDKAENLIFLRSETEALDLAKFLKCDLFVIGGSKTYAEFANTINAWIVTRVPITVDDADVFMPADFLEGYEIVESREVGDSLTVETFRR